MILPRAQLLDLCLRSWIVRIREIRGLTLADKNGLPLVSTLGSGRLDEGLAVLTGNVLTQMKWAQTEFEMGPQFLWHLAGRDRQIFVALVTEDIALAAVAESSASPSAIEICLLAIVREILSLALSEPKMEENRR